ncbi:hypothetical protein [Halobaculum gomorrense]|uniref:Uncharacterized protein n=1 Tax=Halobaculum gomorrense TaxID=43928 RepID=A0A1M5PH21_9EURY|nr:hypothetical protein [Halobaculum gomorrense]SHH00543.1 hypothetical protein SAMN05443636_1581 [Halobaculum gomorrense]
MSSDARYRFVPWVREGYQPSDGSGDDWSVGVTLPVEGTGSKGTETREASVDLSLYGPGEVTGIDLQQVVRTEPTSGTSDFPPNHFPLVELDDPTLPWLFTPETPDEQGKLRPWCCLLTVEKTEGVSLQTGTDAPAAILDVRDPASPGEHLPDLSQSWAWAHAQVVGLDEGASARDALTTDRSTKTLARLLSPRQLEPDTDYYACVVPTFEPGRLAGLGKQPYERDDDGTVVRSHGDAWDASSPPAQLRLPVYYHWEFSTGKAGDFESLVRRLEPSVLDGVGVRQVDAGDPGPSELESPGEVVTVEGALTSTTISTDTYSDSLKPALTNILDQASALAPESAVPGDSGDDRILGPPIYGQWPPATEDVPAEGDPPAWLRDCNVDPRYRVPAAYGTEVVQERQEALMAEAWNQVGDIREANRLLRHARLARTASQSIHNAMGDLSPAARLTLTEPAHGRLLNDATSETIAAAVEGSALPSAVLSPAFRRATRPGGPLSSRLGGVRRERIVEGINDGSITPGDDGDAPSGTQVIGDELAGQLCSAAREREDAVADWRLLGPTADQPITEAIDAVRKACREARERTETATQKVDEQATAELGVLREVLFPICGTGDWESELDALQAAVESEDQAAIRSAIDGVERWLTDARASHETLQEMATPGSELEEVLEESPGVTPAVGTLDSAVTTLWVRLILDGLFAHACTRGRTALDKHLGGDEDPPAVLAELSSLCSLLCGKLRRALSAAVWTGDVRRVRRVVATMQQVLAMAEARLARLRDPEEGPLATLGDACEDVEWYLDLFERRLADAPWDPAADAVGPRVCPRDSPTDSPPLDFQTTADAVQNATDPAVTIPDRIGGRLDGLPLDGRDEPLAQILAHPEFDEPMYGPLRDLSQDKLVPGVGEIPLDSVGVLETNPAFVESYMLGLSHEFARELRWREYPTDLRGTYFRQFWNPEGRDPPLSPEAKKDIGYVHRWDDAADLGGNYLAKMAAKTDGGPSGDAGARVVLVVRGAVFDRYPNTHVYAAKGVDAAEDAELERKPDLPNMDDGGGTVKHPIFRGRLDPDVTFFGFDLTEEEAKADPGWFFVIEEPPSGPSFGLDVGGSNDVPDADWTWEDLTWDDVTANGYVSAGRDSLTDAAPAPGDLPTNPAWSKNGAHMAEITWIRPFRAAIHADDMLPTNGGSQ